MMHDPATDGLYAKFHVERVAPSSTGKDHTDCRYFVLDPQHDAAARAALATYAVSTPSNALREDLLEWLNSLPPLDHPDED